MIGSAGMRKVLLLLAGLLIATPVAPGAAWAQDLPDIEQAPPHSMRVVQRGDHWFLGFGATVQNVGAGVFRIRGLGHGRRTMRAEQVTGDGSAVLVGDVGTLRYVATYGHEHWHYMDFQKYELRGLDIGGVLPDHKQGFCLSAVSFTPERCGLNHPELTTIDEGLEVGESDTYEPNVEGQEIEIDPATTPSGRYVLSSRIGPTGVLRETRTDNNVASTVIEIRWPLTNGQLLAPISTCAGEGCAGPLPAPPVLSRMTAARARRLARRALRRTVRRLPSHVKMRCRPLSADARACRVSWQRRRWRYGGIVRVRHGVVGAAKLWYYRPNIVGRAAGCRGSRCVRRIRRPERLGGTLSGASLSLADDRTLSSSQDEADRAPAAYCVLTTR
jgi:Lysyl oxidase